MAKRQNLWEVFCSFGPTGKFWMFVTIPFWGPLVITFWIIQALCIYLYYRSKAKREVAEAMAPGLAKVAHAESWERARLRHEAEKAMPRPTTNTLYGGTAPTEKPLGD
jgi:hypothetical protein